MGREDGSISSQAPKVVPAYELLERIGEGGSAEVWRGKHHSLGREAAVKLLRMDDASS
jgi:serine/threonine protein kinase